MLNYETVSSTKTDKRTRKDIISHNSPPKENMQIWPQVREIFPA